MWSVLCTILLLLVGLLLMFIILLQRGRGGGLAGAFGGLGGQSAFGTKAGDVFTRITIVLAVIWVILAGVTGYAMRAERSTGRTGSEAGAKEPGIVSPAGKTKTEKKTEEKTQNKSAKQ